MLRAVDRPTATMRRLYHDAFPPDERRPWEKLVELARSEPEFRIDLVEACDAQEAGFITSWRFGAFVYVEHFAIDPALRGMGIGSRALARLVDEVAPFPVVLEVEPPCADTPSTLRRVEFYRRAGFALHDGFDYIQPPYSEELSSVRLMLMSTAGMPDLAESAATIRRRVYGVSG